MRTISTDELKAAAKKFYDEKKLTAQHEDQDDRLCILKDEKGYCCAIGAVMTDEEIALAKYEDTTVFVLVSSKIIDFTDQNFATELQMAHDNWVQQLHRASDETCDAAEYRFLALIT